MLQLIIHPGGVILSSITPDRFSHASPNSAFLNDYSCENSRCPLLYMLQK
jgi:hypothetical protein